METRKSEVKPGKVWWIVTVLLLVIGSAGLYLLNTPGKDSFLQKVQRKVVVKKSSSIKKLLEDRIKDLVIEASDSLYSVNYTKFKINLDSGYAKIEGLKLIPNQRVLKRLIAQKKAPNNILRIHVPEIFLKGMGFKKTADGRRFAISSLYLQSPSVVITNRIRSYNNQGSDPSNLYKAFRLLFNRMAVHRTTINNLNFKYINRNRGVSDHLKNLNVVMKGFRSSPAASVNGKGRTNLKLDYFRLTSSDRFYHIVSTDIMLLPANKSLIIGHSSVLPLYSKDRFYKLAGFAKDRFHWEFDRIVWTGIDIDRFIKTQQLFVDKQTIQRSWMEIYTNYNYPLKEKMRRNSYPQEKFQTIAFDLTFKKTNILSGTILYRILAKETDSVSTLSLSNITTQISNLTNHTLTKRKKAATTVHSKMKLMNEGLMESWYTFNLKDNAAGFTSYSVLGPMNANAFNSLSRPLAKIEVRKGRINKLETYLKMNEYTGKGYVNFYYSDMKIAFLEKDKNSDTLDRKSFLSFVSNMVLPNDNPRKNGEFKTGIVNVKREPWQSFFKIQFDATVDGMSSAMMGVYQKEKGADKNILLKAAKAIAGSNREDKEARKKQRKEKREERKKKIQNESE